MKYFGVSAIFELWTWYVLANPLIKTVFKNIAKDLFTKNEQMVHRFNYFKYYTLHPI